MIRKATMNDYEALERMSKDFFKSSGYSKAFNVPYDAHDMTDLIMAQITDAARMILISEQGDQITGMIAGIVTPWFLNTSAVVAQELAWWVVPEARGGRTAFELLAAFRKWAKEKDATILCMSSIAGLDGEKVNRLYERAGLTHFETSYAEAVN